MTDNTEPTIEELHSNPCIKCYACDFSKDSKCYKGSYKQCSVCAVIQNTIEMCQAIISDQVAKARIDEIKRYREAMTFAHITPSIYASERIPELLSEEQS